MKLAGMTLSVAGQFARGRLAGAVLPRGAARQARRQAAAIAGQRITRTLGELKGAAMKVGQMASMARDVLPEELSSALTALQRDAPPMDYPVIEAQIEREFERPVELLFDHFEREPFASASIGQVHRARTDDGREVVVKVQYPGVDEAVDSDMLQLKLALRASGLLRVNRAALDATFEEIRVRMHEELDYCNEADNVRAFHRFHRRHPFVVVPQVVGERSAQRVLTLTYEPGDPPLSLSELGYTAAERDLCAEHLWRALDAQAFELGRIHADPNPANFAFRRDGTVVMYDFGCTKELAPEVLPNYVELMRLGIARDYAAVDAHLVRMGMRDPEQGPPPFELYERVRDFALPFIHGRPDIDFSQLRLDREALSSIMPVMFQEMRRFQPASELVFFERAVGGHCAMLRKMGATVPVQRILAERVPEVAELLEIDAHPGVASG
jgi:predicted unusual protein kinase regulating ubiquinone biosynthesis (AarF/ABC1/UbiB family)